MTKPFLMAASLASVPMFLAVLVGDSILSLVMDVQ